MFTANHAKAAREMQRVVRAGGRIGMASWTPESFIGRLLKTVGSYIPPPPGTTPPVLWGTRDWLEEHFRKPSGGLAIASRSFVFRYRPPEHWPEVFRTCYGPMLKAFAALDADGAAKLERDILSLVAQDNRASDGTMVVPSEYLEVVIRKA